MFGKNICSLFPFKWARALVGNGEAASVRREMNHWELHLLWWKEDNGEKIWREKKIYKV